ncbi:MAG: site-specific integrase [Bacteroidetes bacterium]|jgi:integrase/recombinase XerD|nr:site-specific integrase [Bacteroidota bacterium]
MKKISLKFVLRRDYIPMDHKFAIYLKIIMHGESRMYSTKIYIQERDWNKATASLRKSARDYYYLSSELEVIMHRAQDIIHNLKIYGKEINHLVFKRLFTGADVPTLTLRGMANLILNRENFADETVKYYEKHLNKIDGFKAGLKLAEVDMTIADEYEKYCISKLGNNANTASKSIEFLKRIMNKAVEHGILDNNPIKAKKVKRLDGKMEYLNVQEVILLDKLFHSGDLSDNYMKSLRPFLFACYTGGLRFSDVKRLTFKNITKQSFIDDETGEMTEKEVISTSIHKSRDLQQVDVPLLAKAKALLPQKELDEQQLFPLFTEPAVNRNLKKIMEIVGINKSISFHCSRHTFATTAISFGMPIVVVQKLMGHKDIKHTMIYAKVADGLKFSEMKKME